MKKCLLTLMSGLLALSMSGCQTLSNQDVGVLAGGAMGGLLGNQVGGGSGKVLATVGGTILGAVLGSQVGASMDRVDRIRLERAIQRNHATSWRNRKGDSYRVVPGKHVSKHCRKYQMEAYVGGQKKFITGKTCYRNGHWEVA